MIRIEEDADKTAESCSCFKGTATRRDFLAGTSCGLIAALVAAGVTAAHALPITMGGPVFKQGTEVSYPIPAGDAANIDQDNDVILVRQANHVYAFSLSCPHENTALRWRQADMRFQCPRHESRYQPDGTFVSGRATRNMDRFSIRRDSQKVIVDLAKLWRSDQQKAQWDAAVVNI
jgi:nitrite reductase/ring-hydroxylating ferredoxin subunit